MRATSFMGSTLERMTHWDEMEQGSAIPLMDLARDSAAHLLDWLTENGENDVEWAAPQDAIAFYEERKEHAIEMYSATY